MFECSFTRASVVLIPALLASLPAVSQTPGGSMVAYPAYPAYSAPASPAPGGQKSQRMRDLFAGSLAAFVEASTGAAAAALTQSVSGTIVGWFDRKEPKSALTYVSSQSPGDMAPAPVPPQNPGDTSGSGYPSYPGAQPPSDGAQPQYPGEQAPPEYPANSSPPEYPGYPANSSPPQYPGYPAEASAPTHTGISAANYTGYPADGSQPQPPSLYAGIAYEIHALDARGMGQVVDPATHAFRTGDRFKVHYRPSLPGRIDVYNINAAGRQSLIDSVSVAGGALETLGPYEFANLTGNETLLLQLSPCSNAALLAATRDIVKAGAGLGAAPASFQMSACTSGTRGVSKVRTRDIRKVGTEGGTSFALDPLQPAELSSGDIAPREVTITLHHT